MQRDELQGIRSTVNNRLQSIQVDNEKKLEQMRQTVDEKLQGTLEAETWRILQAGQRTPGAGLYGSR